MPVRIKLRSDTEENWTTCNPILGIGEFGVLVEGVEIPLFKIGDGTRPWNDLPYQNDVPGGIKNYVDLDDATTVDLPTVNTPLGEALTALSEAIGNLVYGDLTDYNTVDLPSVNTPLNEALAAVSGEIVKTYEGLTDKATVDLPTINSPLAEALTALRDSIVDTYGDLTDAATVDLPTVNTPLATALATISDSIVDTYAELSDAATVDLPTLNEPLALALAGKAPFSVIADYIGPQPLTDSEFIKYDASKGVNATFILLGDRILDLITNALPGASGTLTVTQGGEGYNALSLDSAYVTLHGDVAMIGELPEGTSAKIKWDTQDGINFYVYIWQPLEYFKFFPWHLILEPDKNVYGDYNAPELDWNPQSGIWESSLGPTPILTRDSVATYFNSEGILTEAGIDGIRIDHDPETLECLGALIEPSAEQLFTNTDFSSGWNDYGQELNPGAGSSFAGVASTIWATSVQNDLTQTLNLPPGVYTISAWVRRTVYPEDTSFVYLKHQNAVEGNITRIYPTNEWQFFSQTFELLVDGTFVGFRISNADGDPVELLFPQVELGTVVTSFIPNTTGAPITRAADICSISGTDFSDMWNPDEGTIFCDVIPGLVITNGYIFSVNGGTIQNRVRWYIGNGHVGISPKTDNIEQSAVSVSTPVIAGIPLLVANSFSEATSFVMAADGIGSTDETGVALPPCTQMEIGKYITTQNLPLHFRRLLYWNRSQDNL